MEDCILVDWFQFSALISLEDAFDLLGMWDGWELRLPSKLRYQFRAEKGSISIHYTPENAPQKYNSGVCVEMTGQGCREYETFGRADWYQLFQACVLRDFNVTRFDLAFDDFSGIVPMDQVVQKAMFFHFVSLSKSVQILSDCSDGDPDHRGYSVYHGSRSSDVSIRIYDKRAERKRWDLEHWVRVELQLRHDAAHKVCSLISSGQSVGDVFQGVLHHYLEYKNPSEDSNKSRWQPCSWYNDLVGTVSDIHLVSTRDVVYNQEKLYDYVIGQAGHAINCARQVWGDKFQEYLADAAELPEKYKKLIAEASSS